MKFLLRLGHSRVAFGFSFFLVKDVGGPYQREDFA